MPRIVDSRKAQITVFIIIGVILLFSIGIYSYMRSAGISPLGGQQPKSPPVVAFVEACIEKVSMDALTAMGSQGGYITLPPAISANPTRHVSLVAGVGGPYAPKVPFWYYEGKTEVPSLDYMAYEVERYVDENLGYCLDNYTAMRDEYIITELSNYSTAVVFSERESIISLDYGLAVQPRGKDEVTTNEQFIVRLDLPMKRIWEFSKELLEAENKDTFFENMTLNLMASHPSTKIPFTGMEFHCGRLQWHLSQIKATLIEALEPAVFATRFNGVYNEGFPKENEDAYRAVHNAVEEWRESPVRRQLVLPKDIPEDSYEYFQYYFQFTDKSYNDLRAVAKYSRDWGMNLLATPNEYGVLKSGVQDLKSEIMSFLCINTYHFVYDLTYPVMISVSSPTALHGRGYVFRYAFPVQIYHNAPDRSLLPTTIIEPTEYSMDYCAYQSEEQHTIIARDALTNAELSRVNLTFRCLREECALGTTRTNNRHLQWSGNFPDGCGGPIIVANRSGYLESERQYDGTEPFYIDMYPTQNVVFDVRRHQENAPDVARYLAKGEDMYAVLQLEQREPRISNPQTIFEVFGSDEIFNRTDSFDLIRADALYDVNIILLKKVSEDEDRLVGGWVGNWSVSLNEMLDAKKVIFHVVQKYPTPKTDEEIIEVYELMTNRTRFPDIKPEVIRADEYTGDLPEGGAAP